MAVPATPKLSDLVAEFGGPGNLRAYNRGGTYVPDNATNAAISTSAGGLKLSQFAGAVNSTTVSVTHGVENNIGSGDGTTEYGYYNIYPYGSRSPTSFNGQTIERISFWTQYESGSPVAVYFEIILDGTLAQDFFTTAEPSITPATALTSASASFFQAGGNTIWRWTTGSSIAQDFTVIFI